MAELPLIKAESGSGKDLTELCRRTRVVITTVGPYSSYGTVLVNVCAATGTHYVDITGETDWVAYIQDKM